MTADRSNFGRNPELLLSFIICSRNDGYDGNSLWRLQTALNYLGLQAATASLQSSVEAVVCDWGSSVPLADALVLCPEALAVTRIVEVPRALAEEHQMESPFAEVIANNTAIRRARGRYIGRIDQDTLVGRRFLDRFLRMVRDSSGNAGNSASTSMFFIGRRHVPLVFSRRSFNMKVVNRFIGTYSQFLPKAGAHYRPWFDAPVGIVILDRDLWKACRGYDERLVYWGFMETDLGLRIQMQGRVVDLEREIGCDFYHLDHTPISLTVTRRRKNERRYPKLFAPNGPGWGLAEQSLEIRCVVPSSQALEVHDGSPNGVEHFARDVAKDWARLSGISLARCIRGLFEGDRIEK